MATVYLKKVASSSRSEWVSGTSYVVGDRVWIEDASMVISFTDSSGDHNNNAIRTYVCIKDTSSTNSPLTNSTDWTEAGTKEYPYHSVDGNLTDKTTSPESFLEGQNKSHASDSTGSLFHHLKRGESGYSLGKLIFLADEENPLFLASGWLDFNQFEVEPDPSIKRIKFIITNGSVGSSMGYNENDSTFGRVHKCDFYYTGTTPGNNIIGGIYNNLSKLEFNECYFGPGSKIGYTDPVNSYLNIGTRNFLGLDKCVVDFPNHDFSYVKYDTQLHSTGVGSYIKNSTIRFKTCSATTPLIHNSIIDIKNSIVYFDSLEADAPVYHSNAAYPNTVENFVLYVKDESTYTLDENAGSFTGTVTKIDPQFLDDLGDYRLRPSSPLIGGFKSSEQSKLESQYPNGKWFDSSAAAGGDGSWATPYNDLFDAIESFPTGGTATVLVKEGDHPMNNTWRGSGGTAPVTPSRLEIIGINSNVRLTSENAINSYPMFMYAGFDDADFFYKNIDFHINNTTGYINRTIIYNPYSGKISLHQCKFTQSDTSEIMSGGLFYNSGTGANPAEIELVGVECIVANFRSANVSTSYIFPSGATVNAKNCTFLEPDRSMQRTNHNYKKAYYLGPVRDTSVFENCIFKSDMEYVDSSSSFIGPSSSSNIKFINCSIFHKHGAWTTQGAYDIRTYPSLTNCSFNDPKLVNSTLGFEDTRLRSDSPLIGGISTGSSEEKWIARATLENKTYAFFNPNATGTGNGSSLANACTNIYEAEAAVDPGGYIFVADMDYTFSGSSIRLSKPVQIQALNPGKAIWRTFTTGLTFTMYTTGHQFMLNVSSAVDSDTLSGSNNHPYTVDIDGYYTGMSFSTSSAVTGDEIYNIVNHSFDGTTHTLSLDRAISGTLSGSITFYLENSFSEDSAIRDMTLCDFNTANSANGNGVGFMISSKNNTTAASTVCGSMIFERNSILQTYNINANNKTGFFIRNDHHSVIPTRYKFNNNTISLKNYPGSGGNRVYPHNLGSGAHLSINDAEKRFCSSNSYYFYSNVDSNPDYGTGFNQGSNSIWVIESEYGYTSSSHNGDTLSEGNYAYGVNNANLSANPFVNAIDGDFRLRPNSELLGKSQ